METGDSECVLGGIKGYNKWKAYVNINKNFGKGESAKRKKQDTVLDTCVCACVCMKCVFTDKCDRRNKS